MYKELIKLLEAGFEVSLRPQGDEVKLTVQQTKNGKCSGVEIDLAPMEWGLSEYGIADRLKESADSLIG